MFLLYYHLSREQPATTTITTTSFPTMSKKFTALVPTYNGYHTLYTSPLALFSLLYLLLTRACAVQLPDRPSHPISFGYCHESTTIDYAPRLLQTEWTDDWDSQGSFYVMFSLFGDERMINVGSGCFILGTVGWSCLERRWRLLLCTYCGGRVVYKEIMVMNERLVIFDSSSACQLCESTLCITVK